MFEIEGSISPLIMKSSLFGISKFLSVLIEDSKFTTAKLYSLILMMY